jgi:protein phosphatase
MGSDQGKPLDEEIDVFGMTDVGRVRTNNEDQFLICTLHKQIRVHATSLSNLDFLPNAGGRLATLIVVADGVGGHAAGEVASRLVVETITRYVTHSIECYFAHDPHQEELFLGNLRSSVMTCHGKILSEVEADPSHAGMATTLTVLIASWPRAYVVQVGDSRCYQLRNGEMRRVTRDQTVAQELIDKGKTEEETASLNHILYSAVGGPRIEPVITTIDLQWGDVILLSTDGLTDLVSEDRIRERLLYCKSAKETCQKLVSDALDEGGRDNVTVVVGKTRKES